MPPVHSSDATREALRGSWPGVTEFEDMVGKSLDLERDVGGEDAWWSCGTVVEDNSVQTVS